MVETRSFSGWTRAARMFVALAAGAGVLFAAIAVRGSAAHSTARPQPMVTMWPGTRLHIGPLPIFDEVEDFELRLAATNLGSSARTVTLTLIDQDGSEVAEQQVTIAPGRTRLIGTTFGNEGAVRGRLVSPEGGRFALSLIVDNPTNQGPLWFTDHSVSQQRLPDTAASTALVPSSGGDATLTVSIANLSNAEASYSIRLINPMGNVVASDRISNVPPRFVSPTASSYDVPASGVRVVVTSLDGTKFLPAARHRISDRQHNNDVGFDYRS